MLPRLDRGGRVQQGPRRGGRVYAGRVPPDRSGLGQAVLGQLADLGSSNRKLELENAELRGRVACMPDAVRDLRPGHLPALVFGMNRGWFWRLVWWFLGLFGATDRTEMKRVPDLAAGFCADARPVHALQTRVARSDTIIPVKWFWGGSIERTVYVSSGLFLEMAARFPAHAVPNINDVVSAVMHVHALATAYTTVEVGGRLVDLTNIVYDTAEHFCSYKVLSQFRRRTLRARDELCPEPSF